MNKAQFFNVPNKINEEIKIQINDEQKKGIHMIAEFLNNTENVTEDNLKSIMMKIQEDIGIKAKSLFQAIYLILIGTKKGPRLGPIMTVLDIEWLRDRFSSI